ncbi:hypothetical protein [Noviherbaspirillum aridicola]|uniref:Uncharacterized protein n=1 Tax=Noviherbaspirillum aridicola TaxID=2849687 RepID=A0ABQ4PYW9_9BURK|nr:hypothetical protein [Noviherbaspirillum aridicola]GIZ50093.1 hypothetical protein NCCP691_01070 [Noviherbaspirillum aridicola]
MLRAVDDRLLTSEGAMGMDKCRDCEHRDKRDLEQCLRCHGVAPMRVHVALFLVVLLLFLMAVLASREALSFREAHEGPIARMIRQYGASGADKSPAPADHPATK